MAHRIILVVCSQVIFVQTIVSQVLGNAFHPAILNPGLIPEMALSSDLALSPLIVNDLPFALNDILAPKSELAYTMANTIAYSEPVAKYGEFGIKRTPVSGGGFQVTCSSPIAPIGLTVVSENTFDGVLAVKGELPVLSAVEVNGQLPTTGSGSINFGCGSGVVGITSEGMAPELAYGARAAGDVPRMPRVGYGGL